MAKAAGAGSTTEATLATIERFNAAFNAHDVDAVMALMTDDVLFENTSPAPDGETVRGQTAMREFWTRFFAGSSQAHFTTEDIFAHEDRALVRWIYRWHDPASGPGHIRGVDVFRVRDGKVSEKLAYVKG